jgi:hypothetical protein
LQIEKQLTDSLNSDFGRRASTPVTVKQRAEHIGGVAAVPLQLDRINEADEEAASEDLNAKLEVGGLITIITTTTSAASLHRHIDASFFFQAVQSQLAQERARRQSMEAQLQVGHVTALFCWPFDHKTKSAVFVF